MNNNKVKMFKNDGSVIYVDCRPFIKPTETFEGISGHFVYVSEKNGHVNKFTIDELYESNRGYRKPYERESDDYVLSLKNNEVGQREFQRVKDSLRVIYPKCLVVKKYRGPGKATKDRGTVPKVNADHFDVYVRKPNEFINGDLKKFEN